MVTDWRAELRTLLLATASERSIGFLVYTLTVNPHADPQTMQQLLAPVVGHKAENVIMNAAYRLRQEGYEQGLEQGLEQERARMRRLLMLYLERRFEELPAPVVARVAAGTNEQLQRWLERVLDASSPEDVVAD